ncbi:MAG: hypothetical protein KJ935_07775 [Candidatus Omnitrophica bacterium]|nr:hypothetical protein [Candidatus Omnitrophota bacterium]
MKMHWLRYFPFRVEISPLLFVGAGILSLIIALITVSFQSIRAAVANPIDSLRMEWFKAFRLFIYTVTRCKYVRIRVAIL